MTKLSIKMIDSTVEGTDFDCGNPKINELVRGSYFNLINQIAYTFEMNLDGNPIGYYMIQVKSVTDNMIPEEVSDYWDESMERSVPCVYLHLIAVDKKYQNNGYGTLLMKYIIRSVFNMLQYVPIRILLLKAVADKVDWYVKQGFTKLTDSAGFEDMMYMDCLNDTNRSALQEYEEEG